jgi:site-specific recombinase XerD
MVWFYQETPNGKEQTMTELRSRMIEDMQLHGLAARTQRSYVDAVKGLAKFYQRPPEGLSEDEIRSFFLHLINEKAAARSTVTVYLCGIKFFYETTLGRKLPILEIVRPAKRRKLPVVLAAGEVKELLDQITNPVHRMCLTLIYACGLRLSEGIHLRVEDIDSERMLVAVRNGKGGKDRYVPLPQYTPEQLRAYWSLHRPKIWLFSAQEGGPPLNPTSIQKTFKAVVRQSGNGKNASVHTLRHSYATYLLENGVNLCIIQQLLGHKSPNTTAIYTHLTQKSADQLATVINRLLTDR